MYSINVVRNVKEEAIEREREEKRETKTEREREIITQSLPEMRPHSPAYTARESPLLV